MARQISTSYRLDAAAIFARPAGWMQRLRSIGFGVVATLAITGAAAQERFEVTSVKTARPPLAETVAAIQQRDIARAKAAFDAYDSAWNGIEVYINTRSKEIYEFLEINYQRKIAKDGGDAPDMAALLADAQIMLAEYDEAIGLVSKAAPLNPLYDDVARLRIVRAHLREVPPALKAGDFAKARKSFAAFDSSWDSIEDLIKARSGDNYVAIEKGMIEIEQALMPEKPDAAKATALVNDVMAKYNASLAEVMKEARSKP
jgi:hypothetical protein